MTPYPRHLAELVGLRLNIVSLEKLSVDIHASLGVGVMPSGYSVKGSSGRHLWERPGRTGR